MWESIPLGKNRKPAGEKNSQPKQKTLIKIKRKNIMSKGQNSKKGSKKEPAKTMKEKKAAKREKKNEKMNCCTV
jgi:hypothetical protein